MSPRLEKPPIIDQSSFEGLFFTKLNLLKSTLQTQG